MGFGVDNHPILNLKWRALVSIVLGILTNRDWLALAIPNKIKRVLIIFRNT